VKKLAVLLLLELLLLAAVLVVTRHDCALGHRACAAKAD
jgi:hypothetical protein